MFKLISCPISILVYLLGVSIGLAMFFRPSAFIEFQRRFYAKINWRMEPISMAKEIRNTRLMGLLLFAAVPLAIVYVLSLR
jgi:hypothetical protein